jgi:Uma2 family endonuclease
MSAAPKLAQMHYLTEDEYLKREIEALEKTEYVAGVLYPRWQMMAGGRILHNRLSIKVSFHLERKLTGSKCRTLSSDMRLYNPHTSAYLYPDVVVVCGKPDLRKHQSLVNPTLVVEVASPSSEEYDRSTKLLIYDAMPSVQEYIIVRQKAREIMLFRRNEQGKLCFVEIATEHVELRSVGCILNVEEIYADTDFDYFDDDDENTNDEGPSNQVTK